MNKYEHLNILVHDMINLLYYEYWTDKQKYFYVCYYQYFEKKVTVVLTVKNINRQLNKDERDSRYLEYKCNNRIGDLLPLLQFF